MPSVREPCLYATVKMVRVDNVTDSHLTFLSRSERDELETYVVPLGGDTVLVDPPTDAPTPVTLEKGAIGYLYLSRDGWKSTSKESGATLYKTGTKYVLFKWPLCRPYRLLSYLRVIPSSIVVTGTDLATKKPVTIDVLGPDAAPEQDLEWIGAAPITVKLARGTTVLSIWPKQIVVTASPVKKLHITKTLDILDVEWGDFTQHLRWSKPGEAIDLKLSSQGFRAFKITPNAIAYFARGMAVTYPEDVIAECEVFDDVDEADVREDIRLARERWAKMNEGSGSKLRSRGKARPSKVSAAKRVAAAKKPLKRRKRR